MRFSRKVAVVVAAVAVLAIGGIAFAYFTATGSGTGTASVGSASAITISGTTDGALYPDGPGRTVTITVTNPGAGAQYVDTVSLDSIDASDAGCATVLGTDFSMADVPVEEDLAPGASTEVYGTLYMHDTGVSQDDCQSASLTLNLSSN